MVDPDTMNWFRFHQAPSHAAIEVKIQVTKGEAHSLWSENITEVAREGGSDEVELNWDRYEKANREISYDKLKLAEEKAIRKEQDKMRAEEAAHAKTEKMRRVVERNIHQERERETK
ncbi:hypothetical protein Bca52824_071543 [Brassica carinata]|uniref:Uncharacterized protein n=1 Tax=Brassica carinata TaxID=52824 RepID=A0A8X7U426_BRACI|nr:hypothetical protein Bca52824_071543 [Brassica carinata]